MVVDQAVYYLVTPDLAVGKFGRFCTRDGSKTRWQRPASETLVLNTRRLWSEVSDVVRN